jgi:hypothetical protein
VAFWALIVIVGVGTAIVVSLSRAGRARAEAKRVRRFVAVPLRDLGACRDGELVRIVGVVEAGEQTLKAPSDGAKCVFYASDYFAIVYRDRRRVEDRYASSAHARTFWIVADGHRAQVEVKRIDVESDDTWGNELDAGKLPSGIRKQLLRSVPQPAPRSRYVERRLAPGTRVTVVGVLRVTEGPAVMSPTPGYRSGPEAGRALSIVAPPGGVVRVSTHESTRQ